MEDKWKLKVHELKEFSRISNQNKQYVEEFWKTDLSIVNGWFHIDFIFDDEGIEALDLNLYLKEDVKDL